MEWIFEPTILAGFLTLVILEIVLGIDNLIFIAIMVKKLPEHQQDRAYKIGLSLALFMRIGLLCGINWLAGLTDHLMHIGEKSFSGRDFILIIGGLFLLFKATVELHERLEGSSDSKPEKKVKAAFFNIIVQIILLDLVFSIDSVITAVGMSNNLTVMISAIVIAVILMIVASKPLTEFIHKHPTLIVLCLGFLLIIGFSLIMEGFGMHIPKGYIYAAIGFSLLVESLNHSINSKKKKNANQLTNFVGSFTKAISINSNGVNNINLANIANEKFNNYITKAVKIDPNKNYSQIEFEELLNSNNNSDLDILILLDSNNKFLGLINLNGDTIKPV